jgi:hypothetical protein
MPTAANYVTVPGTDNPIVLPDPQSQINDFHSDDFDAPEAIIRSPAVLFWQVKPEGKVRVQVNLNDQVVSIVNFDSTPQRSWHEVIGEHLEGYSGGPIEVQPDYR